MQRSPYEGCFEPFAIKIGEAMPDEISAVAVAQISLAVSVKRIADALHGVEGTAGLLELLNPLQVRNHY